eukprot:Rhum_TRINITY_DN15024_c4_g1::Rhum_TRINITY_DN15024_c4_g1_i1::g.133799::m.133799
MRLRERAGTHRKGGGARVPAGRRFAATCAVLSSLMLLASAGAPYPTPVVGRRECRLHDAGVIILCGAGGEVTAMDVSTGDVLWRKDTGGALVTHTSPDGSTAPFLPGFKTANDYANANLETNSIDFYVRQGEGTYVKQGKIDDIVGQPPNPDVIATKSVTEFTVDYLTGLPPTTSDPVHARNTAIDVTRYDYSITVKNRRSPLAPPSVQTLGIVNIFKWTSATSPTSPAAGGGGSGDPAATQLTLARKGGGSGGSGGSDAGNDGAGSSSGSGAKRKGGGNPSGGSPDFLRPNIVVTAGGDVVCLTPVTARNSPASDFTGRVSWQRNVGSKPVKLYLVQDGVLSEIELVLRQLDDFVGATKAAAAAAERRSSGGGGNDDDEDEEEEEEIVAFDPVQAYLDHSAPGAGALTVPTALSDGGGGAGGKPVPPVMRITMKENGTYTSLIGVEDADISTREVECTLTSQHPAGPFTFFANVTDKGTAAGVDGAEDPMCTRYDPLLFEKVADVEVTLLLDSVRVGGPTGNPTVVQWGLKQAYSMASRSGVVEFDLSYTMDLAGQYTEQFQGDTFVTAYCLLPLLTLVLASCDLVLRFKAVRRDVLHKTADKKERRRRLRISAVTAAEAAQAEEDERHRRVAEAVAASAAAAEEVEFLSGPGEETGASACIPVEGGTYATATATTATPSPSPPIINSSLKARSRLGPLPTSVPHDGDYDDGDVAAAAVAAVAAGSGGEGAPLLQHAAPQPQMRARSGPSGGGTTTRAAARAAAAAARMESGASAVSAATSSSVASAGQYGLEQEVYEGLSDGGGDPRSMQWWHISDTRRQWAVITIAADTTMITSRVLHLYCALAPVLIKHHTLVARTTVTGFATLLAWVVVLSHVENQPRFFLLMQTLRRGTPKALRFSAGCFPLLMAYAVMGTVLFGGYSNRFASLDASFVVLFALMNGDIIDDTFGAIYFEESWFLKVVSRLYMYSFIGLFVYAILNILLVILEDAYFLVKRQVIEGIKEELDNDDDSRR